jgi:hypothetical protein
MPIMPTTDWTHHTSAGECHRFVSFLAKMLFHDKKIIPLLTTWNSTHYRQCAQKLGEARITYWNPHLEKELSFDRVWGKRRLIEYNLYKLNRWYKQYQSAHTTGTTVRLHTFHSSAVQVYALLGCYMHTLAVGLLCFGILVDGTQNQAQIYGA